MPKEEGLVKLQKLEIVIDIVFFHEGIRFLGDYQGVSRSILVLSGLEDRRLLHVLPAASHVQCL